jgi:hypothetical protein
MKISEYFISRKHENAKRVQLYRVHMAQKDAMLAEFNEIDQARCVPLGHTLAAQRLAGSPMQFETEAQLIKARQDRDAVKYAFHRTRDAIEKEILIDTNPIINEKAEAWLELARQLPNKYCYSSEQIINRNGYPVGVRISTNSDALSTARDLIIASRKRLLEMRLCPLTEIEEFVEKFNRQYESLDLSVLQIEELSSDQAAERRPQAQPADIQTSIHNYGDGVRVVLNKDIGKLKNLSDRISTLEARQ